MGQRIWLNANESSGVSNLGLAIATAGFLAFDSDPSLDIPKEYAVSIAYDLAESYVDFSQDASAEFFWIWQLLWFVKLNS